MPHLEVHKDKTVPHSTINENLKHLSTAHQQQQWSPDAMAIAFGENKKAQMAARVMFELVHQHGDNLREGWKNVLDCLLYLLRAKLLPQQMVEMEDFVDPRGHYILHERFKRRDKVPKKEDSGLFSWLGFSSSTAGESDQSKRPTEEEKELCKIATNVIVECHPEQLIADCRYLATSALTELINNIVHCSLGIAPPIHHQHHHQFSHSHDEHDVNESAQQPQQQESQDDDSLVDLTADAALLPSEQQEQQQPKIEVDTVPEHCQEHCHLEEHLDDHVSHGHSHEKNFQSDVIDQEERVHLITPTDSAPSVAVPVIIPVPKEQTLSPSSSPPSGAASIVELTTSSTIVLSVDEEESLVFLLELMVNIVLENRDRLAQVWPLVRDHLHWLLTHFPQNQQLMERAIVAIIRIANRNLFRLGHPQVQQQQQHSPISTQQSDPASKRNVQPNEQPAAAIGLGGGAIRTKSVVIVIEEDSESTTNQTVKEEMDALHQLDQTIQSRTNYCADEVLQFMGTELLSLRPPELFMFSRQIAFGLQTLLRANAANVHTTEHWEKFFTLLEAIGAAAYPQEYQEAEHGEIKKSVFASNLSRHDPAAFLKVVEILTFLARDAAHITPANFSQFTHCLRMMVEASMDGGKYAPVAMQNHCITPVDGTTQSNQNRNKRHQHHSKQFPMPVSAAQTTSYADTKTMTVGAIEKQQKAQHIVEHGPLTSAVVEEQKISDQERLDNSYMEASLHLLNICVQLHSCAASIYTEWSDVEKEQQQATTTDKCTDLWTNYWRPLLQAIARMACDCRRRIRSQALETLGIAFRVPALAEQMLPTDWADCFMEVIFPLLASLLSSSPPISPMDPIGMEEARIRVIQLTCKILLSNLTPIASLDTFPEILRRLFDLIDQFLERTTCSDLLAEMMQESLKNCVLVCENFGVFRDGMEGLRAEMDTRLASLAEKHKTAAGLKLSL